MKISVLTVLFFIPMLMCAAPADSPPAPAASSTPAPATAIPPLQDKQIIRLWYGDAPMQQGQDPEIDIPTIQAYLPPEGKATGSVMIIFPGGGYTHLSMVREGSAVGEWLAENGITAFVLKYRLGKKYQHPAEMLDAQRAIRYVRAYAPAWKLDPNRLGLIGFSAGGHLASTASTHFTAGDPNAADPIDRVSSRPDLQVLLYPVITFADEAIVHKGSREYLLGDNPSEELKELLSSERQVTRDTPPAFIVHSTADRTVPVANSDAYAAALEKNNVKFAYLRGNYGGHGFGLTPEWTPICLAWLRAQKF